MFLSPGEFIEYCPTVQLTGVEAIAAIRKAQLLAESPQGANRPLEATSHVEELAFHFPYVDDVVLTRSPLISVQQVQIKGFDFTNFGLNFIAGEWQTLEPSSYTIDIPLNQLTINTINAPLYSGLGGVTTRRPTHKQKAPRIRVTYTTGFNTNSTDPKVIEIKVALGALIEVLASKAFGEGQKKFALEGFYEIEYAEASTLVSTGSKSVLDEYLRPFHKYRPRTTF